MLLIEKQFTAYNKTTMIQPKFLLILIALLQFTYGLHFYMDSNDRKCFLEEVPADTLVSGKCFYWDGE